MYVISVAMLDPFSALAVAAGCVQFLDFAWKAVTVKSGIFNKSNSTAKKDELASVAERLHTLSVGLGQSRKPAGEQEGVYKIRDACRAIEEELNLVLNRLKDTGEAKSDRTGRGGSRKWTSTRQALQSEWKDEQLIQLEKRLKELREDLILNILVELRCVLMPFFCIACADQK